MNIENIDMMAKIKINFQKSSFNNRIYCLSIAFISVIFYFLSLPSLLLSSDIKEIGDGIAETSIGIDKKFKIYTSTEIVELYEKRLKNLLPGCHFNANNNTKEFPQNKIKHVLEGQAIGGIGGANEINILHTEKINTCRAVSLYYPSLKAGLLAHFSTNRKFKFDDEESLKRLCQYMSKRNNEEIDLIELEDIQKEYAQFERKSLENSFKEIEKFSTVKIDLNQVLVTIVCGHLTEDLFTTCQTLLDMGLKITNVYYNPVVTEYHKWDEFNEYYDLNRLAYNAETNSYVLKESKESHVCKSLTLDLETGDFWVGGDTK